MRSAGCCARRWMLVLWLLPASVSAQPTDTPTTDTPTTDTPATDTPTTDTPTGDPELSPEELAELNAALGADAAALSETGDAPAASGPAPAGPPQSMNPDLSFILDLSLAAFSDQDRNLQSGGHDPTDNGFNLQGLEMAISSDVDPYLRLDGNLVFGAEGVEIEEIYATTLALPHSLQVRAGQFLTRFGRLNPTHPHSWDFSDQPFAIGRVMGSEGNRGVGVELSYLTPLPWYVELVGSVTDARGEGARSFLGEEEAGVDSPLDMQTTLAAKQFFDLSENWSLLWGLSTATGPNPSTENARSHLLGTDLFVKYRPITRQSYTVVSLQTEWFYRRRRIPGDHLTDTTGYAQLFWRFARRWGVAGRYELGTPARTDDGSAAAALDPLDPEWTDHRHRVSASATFWPSEFSRLRLQGSVDDARWTDDPIWAAFLNLEVLIGAHGAHAF